MTNDLEKVTAVPFLPKRRREAHKGDFGRVLVVGGSGGMPGAVALAANAALRGGAGLVTFAAPRTVQLAIAAMCPCATSLPLACDEDGLPARESVRQMIRAAGRNDVLAVGPGMATGAAQQGLVQAALAQAKPLVLDADGLNNLAAIADWPSIRRCPVILTPHPGEFAGLTSLPVADVQADRVRAAAAGTNKWLTDPSVGPLICVLKGAGTVVTDGRRVFVNATGNPGMATGGSGDVLTGLTAALLGQGLAPFEAACLAVHVHGRAGDLVAAQLGEVSMTAGDLLDFLPAAMKEISS